MSRCSFRSCGGYTEIELPLNHPFPGRILHFSDRTSRKRNSNSIAIASWYHSPRCLTNLPNISRHDFSPVALYDSQTSYKDMISCVQSIIASISTFEFANQFTTCCSLSCAFIVFAAAAAAAAAADETRRFDTELPNAPIEEDGFSTTVRKIAVTAMTCGGYNSGRSVTQESLITCEAVSSSESVSFKVILSSRKVR